MKLIFILFLMFSFCFSKGQKVHSIYVQVKKKTFSNHFKNFTKRDSLVLYEDSTFSREENYWGFDEFSRKVFPGKWSLKNKRLYLLTQKTSDSSKIIEIQPFETVIKIRHLKNNYKKLK